MKITGFKLIVSQLKKESFITKQKLEYLKSLAVVFELPELLDYRDEAIFIYGSAFLDPLVENRESGGPRISGPGDPMVEDVQWDFPWLSMRFGRRRWVQRNVAWCVSKRDTGVEIDE